MSKSQKVQYLTIDGKKYPFIWGTLTGYIFSEKTGIPLEEMDKIEEKLIKGAVRDQLSLVSEILLSGVEAYYRLNNLELDINKWMILDKMGDDQFMNQVNSIINSIGTDLPTKKNQTRKQKAKV